MIYFFIATSIVIGIMDGIRKIKDSRTNKPIPVTNNLFDYMVNTKY